MYVHMHFRCRQSHVYIMYKCSAFSRRMTHTSIHVNYIHTTFFQHW